LALDDFHGLSHQTWVIFYWAKTEISTTNMRIYTSSFRCDWKCGILSKEQLQSGTMLSEFFSVKPNYFGFLRLGDRKIIQSLSCWKDKQRICGYTHFEKHPCAA
jgi:hypothetical protein